MAAKLIFIHGRNQQGRDPDELRAHWIASLQRGFDRLGLTSPIVDDDVIFPFFGDALFELTREDSLDEAEAVIGDDVAPGVSDDEEATIRLGREVVGEVLGASGVSAETIEAEIDPEPADLEPAVAEPPADNEPGGARVGGALSWEWVQAGLSILDRLVPGASAASVAYAAGDVAQYLKNEQVHAEIDAVVAAAFDQCSPGDRIVVVAHSLGSVIAYKLLAHGGLSSERSIASFVTLGSPLGVSAIRDAVSPVVHPAAVANWLNAYDDRDVVALHPLDQRYFDVSPPILDHDAVVNPSPNHHRVEGYLEDPVVALTIHEALGSGRLPPVLARRRRGAGDPARVADLPTPALVVDAGVFAANCAAMDARRPGLELRPHVGAFASTALAKRLAADGHTALCAATPRQIEGLVEAGLDDDLLLANETLDTARLGELADEAHITVAVGSDATLDAAIVGGIRSVLIDVDVGALRGGCRPDDAGRLAERARTAGLEVRGVMSHEAHVMMVTDRATRLELVEAAMATLLAAADAVGGDVISGGGTGTFDTNTWCTEIRTGSYCLMDTHDAQLDLPFDIALELLATVIAVGPDGMLIADAGLTALGTDHGNPSWAHGTVRGCSGEHMTLAPDDPGAWSIGDLIRLQPAHLDSTVVRHQDMWLIDGDQIIDRWPIDLRHW